MSIDFPEDTRIHKRLPKEAFYKRLTLTTALKEKFVTDVDAIFVENSLTRENLHLTQASEFKEILLLLINLKKQDFDPRIAEAIARQNPHKLLFLLVYQNMRQLALFHNKLYRTPWMPEKALTLSAQGFSLEEIWNGFVEHIALCPAKGDAISALTIDARLALQEKMAALEAQMHKLEKAVWREKQPKKKFALFTMLQQYKQDLEGLQRGKIEDAHV